MGNGGERGYLDGKQVIPYRGFCCDNIVILINSNTAVERGIRGGEEREGLGNFRRGSREGGRKGL